MEKYLIFTSHKSYKKLVGNKTKLEILEKLEKEIAEISKRIEKREDKIDLELTTLSSKIKTFTNWAWIFVWTGIGITIFAIIFSYVQTQSKVMV